MDRLIVGLARWTEPEGLIHRVLVEGDPATAALATVLGLAPESRVTLKL